MMRRGCKVEADWDDRIFELQEPSLSSFITLLFLFPATMVLTPFVRPNLSEFAPVPIYACLRPELTTPATLLFTYLIPIIPLIVMVDGWTSAYRTRSLAHILHLANQAAMSISLEGGKEGEVEWKWESGRRMHTWPTGHMNWIVGRRDRGVGED
jgi:hypothetical protein